MPLKADMTCSPVIARTEGNLRDCGRRRRFEGMKTVLGLVVKMLLHSCPYAMRDMLVVTHDLVPHAIPHVMLDASSMQSESFAKVSLTSSYASPGQAVS